MTGVCAYCHAELDMDRAREISVEIKLDTRLVAWQVLSIHPECIAPMSLKLACCVDGPMKEATPWKL